MMNRKNSLLLRGEGEQRVFRKGRKKLYGAIEYKQAKFGNDCGWFSDNLECRITTRKEAEREDWHEKLNNSMNLPVYLENICSYIHLFKGTCNFLIAIFEGLKQNGLLPILL